MQQGVGLGIRCRMNTRASVGKTLVPDIDKRFRSPLELKKYRVMRSVFRKDAFSTVSREYRGINNVYILCVNNQRKKEE